METFKNFLVGLLVVIIALIMLTIGFLTWPFLLGFGSVILFIVASVVIILIGFYLVALIGFVVRKGLKNKEL